MDVICGGVVVTAGNGSGVLNAGGVTVVVTAILVFGEFADA